MRRKKEKLSGKKLRFLKTGQSTGIVQLFDRKSLDIVIEQRIHTGKITHVEFSKHHEYLLATSSASGREVKIWDVRRMKDAAQKVPNSNKFYFIF